MTTELTPAQTAALTMLVTLLLAEERQTASELLVAIGTELSARTATAS